MLIKGVTGGKEKGNPIEYSPEEKFPLAVEKFLKDQAPEGKLFLFTKVQVDQKHFSPQGQSENGFANNVYQASGKVWYKVHDLKSDDLFPVTESAFDIEFSDGVDELGVPDLKATKFTLH